MQTREIIQRTNYERYEANRRFEEMTDIAERIGYPIVTTIQYEMRDGAAYCMTDTKDRPFHEQTALAKLEGEFKFSGNQAFERTRLSHEHDEALLVDEFGQGSLDGNILIKYSKIPDAVVRGETDINGYRRDLLRHFVRVYYRTEAGVDCTLFTLDKNNQLGTEYAGYVLGLDTLQPSEDLLADYALMNVADSPRDFVDSLKTMTIEAYDKGVYEETGVVTYAGSDYTDKSDAMTAISTQASLMDQHMEAISSIMRLGLAGADQEQRLEIARKRTAAAIKLASEGHWVASSDDISVTAEMANSSYDRDCATANGMNQTQSMENKWESGECRVCFRKTQVGSCMVCAQCAAADDRGVDLLKLRDQNLRRLQRAQAMQAPRPHKQEARTQKPPTITQIYGQHARKRLRVVVGGAVEEIYDNRTGDVIATVA